uniref:Proteasome assembly chaperone 2 n=1 Tax=Tetradesmus obliquus TaxID=3088 RepID=A0A383VH44_TETOB|eukprot:jgi/Sobl393_1/10759/SZX64817.1
MSVQLYKAGDADPELQGAVLVLPAVAFANIGELTVDVLVCTLKAQLVARLDEPDLLACAGNNAYSLQPPGLLATALELYQVPGSRVFLLQQRAPTIPGRQQAFAASIMAWAKQAGFAQLLLLCGLDAQYRREQQLEGTQLRFLDSSRSGAAAAGSDGVQPAAAAAAAGDSGSFAGSCSAVGLRQLESDIIQTEREVHGLLPPWPLLDAAQQQALPVTLLATFAAEGDNVEDALALAGRLLRVLQLQGLVAEDGGGAAAAGSSGDEQGQGEVQIKLQVPCSWVGLYGRSFDKSLF